MVRHAHNPEAGFSLIEMLVVATVFVIGSSIALGITNAALPSIRADGQARRVVALLQYGRELAIATRRDHALRFDLTAHTAALVRLEGGQEFPVETLVFEDHMRFEQITSLGAPPGFGANGPIDFGNAANLIFESDGVFVDDTGLPINGTIFLGIDNALQSARAITVTGTTARARVFRWKTDGAGGGAWSTSQ